MYGYRNRVVAINGRRFDGAWTLERAVGMQAADWIRSGAMLLGFVLDLLQLAKMSSCRPTAVMKTVFAGVLVYSVLSMVGSVLDSAGAAQHLMAAQAAVASK